MSATGIEMLAGIDGVEEIVKALSKFTPTLQKKIIRKTARRAAKIVRDRAKDYVPVDSGDLEDSLKVRALKRSGRSRNKIGAQVASGNSTSLFSGDTYYGGFIEYGAPRHRTFGGGLSPLSPDPFLRPALYDSSERVRHLFRTDLKSLVNETTAGLSAGSIDQKGKRIK